MPRRTGAILAMDHPLTADVPNRTSVSHAISQAVTAPATRRRTSATISQSKVADATRTNGSAATHAPPAMNVSQSGVATISATNAKNQPANANATSTNAAENLLHYLSDTKFNLI